MNRYDSYIIEYLAANKEVALEKIGTLILSSDYPDPEAIVTDISFHYDKRISTSPGLIDFIAEKMMKNRSLIESDLDSHLMQAREFINIGKPYEILNAGLIKANNQGEYEFVPFSKVHKAQKTYSRPARSSSRRRGNSAIQVFTLLIVLAIVGGLGWEAYQFYIKPKTQHPIQNNTTGSEDSVATAHSDSLTAPVITYNPDDSVTVHYIFETTDLLLRAKTRTAQLKGFGNEAGYDSLISGNRKLYSLYIAKKTKIADTLTIKDSLQKFLQKNIQIKIAPKQ